MENKHKKQNKNRNCAARSKQKRRGLRMKNSADAIEGRRARKRIKAHQNKGKTFRCYINKDGVLVKAKNIAKELSAGERGFGNLFDHNHARRLNQRQKRKRYRQSHHCN